MRTEFLNKLAKGQVRKGVVSSIVNFGAFVDLGGVDGLVHVSELSWKHIDHPSEVVEVGQEVKVEVLDVDLDRERVSLSLKATQEDPWRQFARTHAIEQIVPGKVTKLVPFGAFVRVDDGIEGLVHISELAERHVEIPEQVVQVGSDVMVKVIDIDLERRRISLSLKQANEGFVEGEEHFDPTLYGMAATYDTEGNYIYPEGFDPETGEWLDGFDKQREDVGEAVRRGPHPLGGAHQAGADRPRRRRRRGRAGDRPAVRLDRRRPRPADQGRPRSRPAPWPPTRRSPHCARSWPAARADRTDTRRGPVRSDPDGATPFLCARWKSQSCAVEVSADHRGQRHRTGRGEPAADHGGCGEQNGCRGGQARREQPAPSGGGVVAARAARMRPGPAGAHGPVCPGAARHRCTRDGRAAMPATGACHLRLHYVQ